MPPLNTFEFQHSKIEGMKIIIRAYEEIHAWRMLEREVKNSNIFNLITN